MRAGVAVLPLFIGLRVEMRQRQREEQAVQVGVEMETLGAILYIQEQPQVQQQTQEAVGAVLLWVLIPLTLIQAAQAGQALL
jgi:hypothetical protein